MLAAQIQNNFDIDVAELPVPALPPNGGILRLIGCGVCGSDLDKFVNHKANPGSVLGHEVVGILDALDDGHPLGFKLGDRIVVSHHVPCETCHYCLNGSESMCRQFKTSNFVPGGFSQYIALSHGHLEKTAFRIPPDITDAEASCMEPLACVLRAIRRGGQWTNGSVAVIGLGFIGLMASQVYQHQGYSVYGLDIDPGRLQLARSEMMLTQAFHALDELDSLNQTLNAHTLTGKVDAVFLSVVNQKTLNQALELVRDGGTIIVFTSAAEEIQVNPTQLYFREINLITSYSPALNDLRTASAMIFNRQIKVAPLMTHTLSLPDIRQAFDLYRSGQAIKVFVESNSSMGV